MNSTTVRESAIAFLAALRAAGSEVFLDPDADEDEKGEGRQRVFVSPPFWFVDWPEDTERAIDRYYDDLRELLIAEADPNNGGHADRRATS